MADFQTPFGSNSGRRLPTADEKINGFPCGPADQTLFNGLFHRLESELGQLISYAGLTGSDADNSQVRKAVEALISAATGGGDVSNYLLMTQARARLPVYPEIDSADNKINITSPAAGTVRVPAGVPIVHRGIYELTSDETDFNTASNKTYHIRWNPNEGFVIKDLADSGYNPGALAETDISFDSSYDDMLLARVITNSSNVSSITNLMNAHTLRYEYTRNAALFAGSAESENIIYDFARKPEFIMHEWVEAGISSPSTTDGSESNWSCLNESRYSADVNIYSYNSTTGKNGRPGYRASFFCFN